MAICFIFLLMLLQTHLSLHSSLSIQIHEDVELRKHSTIKLDDKSLMEDSNRRLELHEVHSGPNPISNSFTAEVPENEINSQTAP